jgi:hypothetical protein
MKFKLFVVLLTFSSALLLQSAEHVSLFSSNAVWRLFKGRTEASLPDVAAWRTNGFDDSAFVDAQAPFFVGEPYTFGTLLDSPREYTCIFLRKTFEVTNVEEIARLRLHAKYDDGIIVWINGTEVQRRNMPELPDSPVTYTNLASVDTEAVSYLPHELFEPMSYLVPGSNVIAVQVFNVSSTNDDLVFDGALEAVLVDTNAPVIVGVAPPPGPVINLAQITVTFSELVFGVDARDLLIGTMTSTNAATSVTTNGNAYTFTFHPPPQGPVHISWAPDNGIVDEALNFFNGFTPGAQWDYANIDTLPPTIVDLQPAAGSLVHLLNEVRITFSEPVRGVDATDLLLNGQTALNVITQSASSYVFEFEPPPPGNVEARWADGHGITDLAPGANAFASTGSWSYVANRLPYSIFLNPNTNTAVVTFSNRFFNGVCTVEGRDRARWVPLANFFTTQRVGQATVSLPTNYPKLRLVCMDVSPGNAQVRLALAYGNIRTVAGKGEAPPGTNAWRPEYEGAIASEVNLSDPRYALADNAGNIYVVERAGHAVDKITPDGRIHTFVGTHQAGFTNVQDAGAVGTNVLLNSPSAIWIVENQLFILDGGNNRLRSTDLASPVARTATVPVTDSIGTNASGLWVGLDTSGVANEAFYGVGKELHHWNKGLVEIVTSNFFEVRNITLNPQNRRIVADPIEGRLYRVLGNGFKELVAGSGFNRGQRNGGDVEHVPLPGASSLWYLPTGFVTKDLGLGYFISLDAGAAVWYVDRDDNASPFIFGKPGVHAGDGMWFRKGGRAPKVSNVLSVTMSPAGDIILVEGNGFVRKIDFLRHRP